MRILVANDGIGDGGGVQTYLEAVMQGLLARGHELSLLHCDMDANKTISAELSAVPHFSIGDCGLDKAVKEIKCWSPEVCFSHNMHRLDVERRLLDEFPVVKFMHGFFGTCIGGQKTYFLPFPEPCHRQFGKACLALYLPRRCGHMSMSKMISGYEWAKRQNTFFPDYKAIIVASEHMRREYIGNGADEARVSVNPLFSADLPVVPESLSSDRAGGHVLFLGRMTKLKGGELLIRSVAETSHRIGTEIPLTMAGDGPMRASWEQLARRLNVKAMFVGWVDRSERVQLLERASVLAIPSAWPEPFGLVGLEAAVYGVPAIAFDVGGIREWLRNGVNGHIVPGRIPTAHALADGLVSMLTHPERLTEMRTAARDVARELSLSNHLNRLERTLSEAGVRTI